MEEIRVEQQVLHDESGNHKTPAWPSFQVTDAFEEESGGVTQTDESGDVTKNDESGGVTQNDDDDVETDNIEKCCYPICLFKDLPGGGPSLDVCQGECKKTKKFYNACNAS